MGGFAGDLSDYAQRGMMNVGYRCGSTARPGSKTTKRNGNEVGELGTYPIGNCTAHTGNHGNAAPVSKANHLLGHGLCGHEHTSHIDFEHGVAVLGRILQGRGLLLDARRSN